MAIVMMWWWRKCNDEEKMVQWFFVVLFSNFWRMPRYITRLGLKSWSMCSIQIVASDRKTCKYLFLWGILSWLCVTMQCPHGSWPCRHAGGFVLQLSKSSPYMCFFCKWYCTTSSINNGWLLYHWDAKSLGVQKHKKIKACPCLDLFVLLYTQAFGILMVADAHGRKEKGRPSKGREEDVQTRSIQRPVTPKSVGDVCCDQMDQIPGFTDKGRCRFCLNGQTTIFCQKCDVCLCIITRNSPYNCF